MVCDLCQKNNWKKGKKLYTCQSCGFVRAADRYYKSDFAALYSKDYYQNGDYYNYEWEELALKRNFSNRLALIQRYVDTGELLEVGSAYGFFLELAQKYFKVEGVEMDSAVAKRVGERLGVKIYGGDFLAQNFSKKYDLIVALDTIEHVASPSEFLHKCQLLLNPEGYLFLETGDIEAFVPRIRAEKWRLVYPPVHLSYLSAKTLLMFLEKAGFKTVTVERVWFWRSLAQVVYRTFPLIERKIPSSTMRALSKIIFPTYTGDLIFVAAQKRVSEIKK